MYNGTRGGNLLPIHQRKGYGFEAVSSMVNYVFVEMNKHRVIATVDPGNLASIALLIKMGMRREAHFKKSAYLNGQWVDDVVYAILKEEWKGRSTYKA